jgi:hypothetical protein
MLVCPRVACQRLVIWTQASGYTTASAQIVRAGSSPADKSSEQPHYRLR